MGRATTLNMEIDAQPQTADDLRRRENYRRMGGYVEGRANGRVEKPQLAPASSRTRVADDPSVVSGQAVWVEQQPDSGWD